MHVSWGRSRVEQCREAAVGGEHSFNFVGEPEVASARGFEKRATLFRRDVARGLEHAAQPLELLLCERLARRAILVHRFEPTCRASWPRGKICRPREQTAILREGYTVADR